MRQPDDHAPGADPALAFVVAHFDPRGSVSTNLHNLLRHLAGLTSRIVLVSTGISPQNIERIAPYAKVIARDNVGYDFWSYKLGIDALGDRSGLQRLILCNSSFVTADPRRLCDTFLNTPLRSGLRGITASAEGGQWHAQSYWVAFEHGTLINSPEFAHWWDTMVPISDRAEVIRRYEIGMSARFEALGVPVLSAYVPSYHELLVAACRAVEIGYWRPTDLSRVFSFDLELARALNPTHFLWDSLLDRFAIVKLELLRSNPLGINLTRLHARAQASAEFTALIRDAVSP